MRIRIEEFQDLIIMMWWCYWIGVQDTLDSVIEVLEEHQENDKDNKK